MKLIYLHGPPASGKLTIAKAILDQVPGRLFDNHAAIDLARTVFDFGTDGFWSLVGKVRSDVIQKASEYGVDLMVMTSCYSHPEDYEAFRELELTVMNGGGAVYPVFLECAWSELKTRVANQDRVDRRKVHSESGLNEFLDSWNIVPVPRENCLKVRSDDRTARDVATQVIEHFQISRK